MDEPFRASTGREHVRLSDSPQRTPHISLPVHSPTKSVHPEVGINEMLSQSSFGHHAGDFFDDSSEEDRTVSDAAELSPSGEVFSARKKEKRSSNAASGRSEPVIEHDSRQAVQNPGTNGEQKGHRSTFLDGASSEHSSDISFNDSVNELLQPKNVHDRSSLQTTPHAHYGRIAGTGKASARASQSPAQRTSKADHLLSAHAIAHEITLQALIRDGETTASKDWLASDRLSVLSSSLRPTDAGGAGGVHSSRPVSRSRPRHRNVSVVPPPFDPSMHGSLPADLVRTPYPREMEYPDPLCSDKSNATSTSRPGSASESVLNLTLRRSNRKSPPRATTMKVPRPSDFAAVKTRGRAEKDLHFKAIEFDDQALFEQLGKHYRRLAGRMHMFGARSLARITVVGPTGAGAGAGGSEAGNCPFNEQQLMERYRRPKLGKSHFTFVRWVHGQPVGGAAAAEPPRPAVAVADRTRVDEKKHSIEIGEIELGERHQSAAVGLEFVVTWSLWRILVFALLVILSSIAAAVCWTLLGKTAVVSDGRDGSGGFRDAGDRVAAGVLMGVGVLLLGLSCMAGWLGISWLAL